MTKTQQQMRLAGHKSEAQRLEELTRLQPIWFSSQLDPDHVIEVAATQEPKMPFEWSKIVGVRMFHAPREIVVERVRLPCPVPGGDRARIAPVDVQIGPFDAAAYALEAPLPPLTMRPEKYRGDPLRFVAVDWGWTSVGAPLCFEVRTWDPSPSVAPYFEGVLIVEPWTTTGDPFAFGGPAGR